MYHIVMKEIKGLRALAIAMMLMICATISMAQTKSHTVTRGETIESIAQKYGVTVEAIKQANPNMGSMFYVGMKLNIPEVQEKPVMTQNKPEPVAPVSKKEQQPQQPEMKDETTGKEQITHIDYFNSLKSGDKGVYGFGFDHIGSSEGWGMSMRIYTNLFLVDSEFSQYVTAWGANYHAKIDKVGYFVFPAMLSVFGYNKVEFDDKGKKDTKTKIGAGLLVNPYFAFGKKGGIAIGPTFSYSFVNGESSWGGYVGIWF